MDKRLKILILFFAVCGCILFASCFGESAGRKDNDGRTVQQNGPGEKDPAIIPIFQKTSVENGEGTLPRIAAVGDDIPVSRALVAKMLAYIDHDDVAIDGLERMITFTDTEPEAWYDRYINAVVTQGVMSGGGTEFMPDAPLTLGQAQTLLDKLDADNKVKIQLNDENRDKAISYALWTNLYYELLRHLSGDMSPEEKYGIETVAVIALASRGNNSQLKEWHMITSSGPFSYKGLFMDDYIDQKISILKKGGEVLAFLGVADYAPVIENAYIVSKTDESITIFIGGAERTYAYQAAELPPGDICDIKINGSTAEHVQVYTEKLTGIVRKVNADVLEIDGRGQIKRSEAMTVYSVPDGVPKWKTINALTMGTDIAEYVTDGEQIIAVIITKTTLPQTVRVALNTSGFGGLLHDTVALTSDTRFRVTVGNDTKTYPAGEIFSVTKDDGAVFQDGVTRIFIEPAVKTGRIQINSIQRAWENGESPKYRGKIEIGLETDGLTIVNDLSMEEYLYAVIPSEMPAGHGLEAAKVQAVTARSYAYNQYYSNKYYEYGANIDDSVNSQVYNNIPENGIAIQAADATAGQCLVFGSDVISANYFSTSAGTTANAGEVWANAATRQFPDKTAPYLSAVKQYTDGDYGDLRQEENAGRFLKDTAVTSYDAGFPWFRWRLEMTAAELSASINQSLGARYAANPRLIQTLDPATGAYRGQPVTSIGTVRDLEVIERGAGGNIMRLKITGTEATILVSTEYNIRTLLKPAKLSADGRDIVITRIDSSFVENYSLLPSAYFVMDKTIGDDGLLVSVLFSGGGNGHGVGMSQNGVKGMIDAGFTFDEILRHYYNGTEVRKMI